MTKLSRKSTRKSTRKRTRKNKLKTTIYSRKHGKNINAHYKRNAFPIGGHDNKTSFDIVKRYLYGEKNPAKNFITFVNTKGDYYQDKIHADTKNINFIDHQPYFKIKEMAQQMVHMMANLFKDKNYKKANGATTIGSSEAIYVSTIMHKYAWQERHNKKSCGKCNMIWSENTHINWDKAAAWNDIKARKIKLKHLNWTFGAEDVEKLINPNTISVICTICSTRSGQNDNVAEINSFLKAYYKRTGIFVPIHIDAAIGGFLAPFHAPKKLRWSFELEHVKSINVSFHKYGGTYAGLGMLVVKSDYKIPDKMRFFFDAEHMNLDDTKKVVNVEKHKWLKDTHSEGSSDVFEKINPAGNLDLQINFSKPSSQIASAFYILMKFGKKGYKKMIMRTLKTSKILGNYLNSLKNKHGEKVLIPVNEPYYPVLCFCLNDEHFPLKEILVHLSEKYGYSIPAYKMGSSHDIVLRLVFKHNVTIKQAKAFRKAWEKTCQLIYYNNDEYE